MKTPTKQLLFILFLGFLNIYHVVAVPAYPHPRTIKQPDGSEVTIIKYGDESYHYTATIDGYLVQQDEHGVYYFAEKDATGTIKRSTLKAINNPKTIKNLLKTEDRRIPTIINKKIVSRPAFALNTQSSNDPKKGPAKSFQNTGSRKALVILAQFSDKPFSSPTTIQGVMDDKLNLVGYNSDGHIGSVHDYYYESSREQLDLDFVVVGPYTALGTVASYGANDGDGNDVGAHLLVKEMCTAANNDGLDFTQFDTDNDGEVDNVYVIYAGKGEADGGAETTIWPHAWDFYSAGISLTVDGKTIGAYGCNAELNGSNVMSGNGTFTHEFGHVIGLPDLYDTDYATNGTAYDCGSWSLMASGAYNNDGCTPPQLSIVSRLMLGWETPVTLSTAQDVTITSLNGTSGATNQGYKITTANANEYYILENRQKSGWDAYLPGHGMIVYHIDKTASYTTRWDNNMINAYSDHQCWEIEKASGTGTKEATTTPFPGTANITSFTDATTPSMQTWSGVSLNKPITEISESAGNISFAFMGGSTGPELTLPANSSTVSVGTTRPNISINTTITVKGVDLTATINLAITGTNASLFTLSASSVTSAEAITGKTITITYNPTAVGSHTASLTISSSTSECTSVVVTLNGSCTIIAPAVTSPTYSEGSAGGNITSFGGAATLTENGIYYSTTSGFANGSGTKIVATTTASATGTFSVDVSMLPEGTYYFKAFASNSTAAGYSSQGTFTIDPPAPAPGLEPLVLVGTTVTATPIICTGTKTLQIHISNLATSVNVTSSNTGIVTVSPTIISPEEAATGVTLTVTKVTNGTATVTIAGGVVNQVINITCQ